MKISKKQALFNGLVVNVLMAKLDYDNGKITLDTLAYTYKNSLRIVMCNCEFKFFGEWYKDASLNRIAEMIR